MTLSLWERFCNFLFEFDSVTVTRKEVAQVADKPVEPKIPPINDHRYLLERLHEVVPKSQYASNGSREDLRKFSAETLRRIVSMPRLTDFYSVLQYEHSSEAAVRTLIVLMDRDEFKGIGGNKVENGFFVVTQHHDLDNDDISDQDDLTISRIAAAVLLVAETELFLQTPPQLTDFAMRHPERVNEIVGYVKDFHPDAKGIHGVDLERLSEYLASDNKALREGIL